LIEKHVGPLFYEVRDFFSDLMLVAFIIVVFFFFIDRDF
jgi:hypothetical protein